MADISRLLTARWILPITSGPIRGGWIRCCGDEIVEVSASPPPPDAIDYGNVAILPGLVNAHTHLEFSDLAAPIGAPSISLPDWISLVIDERSQTDPETTSRSIAAGLRECHATGTCLIGDITTPPVDYPLQEDAPELVLFTEVLGLSEARSDERFAQALLHHQRYENSGWSPHAPYSTTVATINRCVGESANSHRPLAMHVAESPFERELLTDASGPMAEALKAIGVWRKGMFPWGADPVHRLIDMLAQSSRGLLIHGNDLQPDEIMRLAKHPNLTLVHCPRTHAFFGYPPHPINQCLSAGVPIALGTDSRASNPDLNLWREVQYLLNHRPDLPPAEVLRMATVNGADALMKRNFGRLERGCVAHLGMIQTEADSVERLYEDCASNAYQWLR